VKCVKVLPILKLKCSSQL